MLDVVAAESGRIHGSHGSVRHQSLELGEAGSVVGGDGAVQGLVRQGGDGSLIDKAGLAQEAVGDGGGGRRGEHGADVDGHVEQAEGAVSFGRILGVVVQITYQHLQVALEQARTHGNHEQGTQHERNAHGVGACRDGKGQVTGEHDTDTRHDALAVADLVGQDTAYDRHEINQGQENGVHLAGNSLVPAKLGLEEQHEDGQHGVVAEALTGIGQGKGKQPFRLILEHIES